MRWADIDGPTTLPGLTIDRGVLVADRAKLLYPGDLLHEAGHLAVMPPSLRAALVGDAGSDPGREMAAIAWSWAAIRHLGLDPAVVFHDDGYLGGARNLIENFAAGRYIGVPILQWLGLTDERYPEMRRWVLG